MNPVEAPVLRDVQNSGDERDIAIDAVGIASLRYPVVIAGRDGDGQRTPATAAMDVHLPAHLRGTHMSRCVEVLDEYAGDISVATAGEIAGVLRERLHSERACISLEFSYFLERTAPVSGMKSVNDYEGRLVAAASEHGTTVTLGVRVALTSLCPCSKEISDYGAHNQRGYLDIDARCHPPASVWLEDLIELAESCGSAPIYPLLKRVDERHVTMQAYDNPVFVEDIARRAAVALKADERISAFVVRVANQESIHNHEAVARVTWERA
jgi:GTP cyclohydrolase I